MIELWAPLGPVIGAEFLAIWDETSIWRNKKAYLSPRAIDRKWVRKLPPLENTS